VRRPHLIRHLATAAGLASFAALSLVAFCASPTTAATSSHKAVKPTTNKGLCKLVPPSVVATAVSVSMKYPLTVIHKSETQCEYRSKQATSTAVFLRYDTDATVASFAKSRQAFENRGLKLGPVNGLGDQAYYFSLSAGQGVSITTVVVLKGNLQILTTGTGEIDQIGAISRYALTQYEGAHPQS
jgi:hypothetical protein